jgi:phosphatidylserine/phosphatidylglycerophosphate/cardiolipin synthase-like enzyme
MSDASPEEGDERDIVDDESLPAEQRWWQRSPQEWWALARTWPGLLSIAIAVTIVGAWLPWSFDGPVRLGGLEGSHDGWLAVLSAAAAIATVRGVRRRSWPQMVIALIWVVAALYFVVRDRPPPDSHLGWGWFVALVGTLGMVAAVIGSIAARLRGEPESRWVRQPFSWRRVVGSGVLIAVSVLVSLILWQVIFITEDDSWPPPADAITAAGAQAATEQFTRGSPRPRDLDLDYAWTTAATVEPFAEGAEFYPRIVEDIQNATESVHILMFGWDSNEIGTELADVLKQKLAEGVEVRIVVDDQGSDPDGKNKDMYSDLVRAGAEVVANDTIQLDFDGLFVDRRFDWRQDEFGRAEHRKLYVIDGTVAWTGGAGIQDHFANGRFHDVMARVTGDVVRQAQAVFLTAFRAYGGPVPDDLAPYFPAQPESGTLPTALVQVVPGGYVSATQATRELIDKATTRLDLMNPYLTDADMLQRLIAAAKRGVHVRVVVSETSNNKYAEAALSHHYRDLIDAGVEVWEYPGAVVHAKIVVADDTVQFGTLNLDAWALYRDFELGMVVEDSATAELFESRVFAPDIARSQPGQPPSGVWDRSTAWLWDKLTYFL